MRAHFRPNRFRRGRESVGSRGGRRPRDDLGTAELVVATPLLLLLILAVIQFAVYEHASQVAQTTAAQALATARVTGATAASGQAEAESLLANLGHGVLVDPQVSVSRDATTARVTVTGKAEGVIPLLHLSVSANSSGPIERFVGGP